MAISTIQLVDTDLSTVVFDLHSSDGSTNSSWGSVITKFGLGGSFKVEAPHDAERFQHPAMDGAFTTFSRRGLGTATWRQVVTGSSEANLRLGVGRLTDLVTRGGILRIVTGATTRYLRFEPSPYPQPFQGKELELHDIYQATSFRQGLDITLACQPYWEGAEVSVSSATVPMDPATSTKVRVFPVSSVTGDLPTPAKVKIQPTTGGPEDAILVAWRARNTRASSYFADYLSDTGFVQCEATGRGWTISLGTDTAGNTDANASPGSGTSIARCTYATATALSARVQADRTTKLDSLRGTWDVYLRCKASAAAVHTVQLKWGPTTGGGMHTNDTVTHDTSAASSFGYVELNLGRIFFPEDTIATLATLTFQILAGRSSGTGNLDMDYLWLVPASNQGTVVSVSSNLVSNNESARTVPSSYAVHLLDTSGNYNSTLGLEGAMPAVLQPGDNHLMVCMSRAALANYNERQTVNADIATVSVVYAPRFAF